MIARACEASKKLWNEGDLGQKVGSITQRGIIASPTQSPCYRLPMIETDSNLHRNEKFEGWQNMTLGTENHRRNLLQSRDL